MKVPKYIDKLLEQHEKLGESLQIKNNQLWEWLNKNGIELDSTDIYCHNSILIITEPFVYVDGIRKLIKELQDE